MIQRRLNYILILNTLQEFVTMTEILTPISTDHSLVLFPFSKEKVTITSKRSWKFNSSFNKNQTSDKKQFYQTKTKAIKAILIIFEL